MGAGDWAQIAGAVGALAAVLVALFGRQTRVWLVPPRLDLRVQNGAGVRAGDTTWYHLRVSNPRRWSPITSVRVFLLRVEMDSLSEPWLDEVPLRWRFQKPGDESLDFGFPRDCDLCEIGGDNRLRLQHAIEWELAGPLAPLDPPVRMKLTLQARGLEADSAELKLVLDWSGSQALTLSPTYG